MLNINSWPNLFDEKALIESRLDDYTFAIKENNLYPSSLLIYDELKQDKASDDIMSKSIPKSITSFEFPDFLQLPGTETEN